MIFILIKLFFFRRNCLVRINGKTTVDLWVLPLDKFPPPTTTTAMMPLRLRTPRWEDGTTSLPPPATITKDTRHVAHQLTACHVALTCPNINPPPIPWVTPPMIGGQEVEANWARDQLLVTRITLPLTTILCPVRENIRVRFYESMSTITNS